MDLLSLQRLHTPPQHQRLRRFPLQVGVGVAGLHQDEPVQRELQPRRGRHYGPGPADEERVRQAKLHVWTDRITPLNRLAVTSCHRPTPLSPQLPPGALPIKAFSP